MQNPITIEIANNDSIVITKNGTVVAFVEVQRERNGNVELCAHPVNFYTWSNPYATSTYHSFSTTLATQVESPDDVASAENFINFMNKKVVA